MGITFLTFNGLFAPVRQLVGWLASKPFRASARVNPERAAQAAASHRTGGRPAWAKATRADLPARRPLRVLRVADAQHTPATAGRMVISGRMADVCAELDRMAALEPERA